MPGFGPIAAVNTIIDTPTTIGNFESSIAGIVTVTQADEAVEAILTAYIEKRFIEFPYHNVEYARRIMNKALELFDALAVTHEGRAELIKVNTTQAITSQLALAGTRTYLKALALGNDINQSVQINPKSGMLMRSREVGLNRGEGWRAEFIYELLGRFEDLKGNKMFSGFTLERIRQDIAFTTIEFNMEDIEVGERILYINSPSINRESSATGVLLAASELKIIAGGESPTDHIIGSNEEFRELNSWIGDLVKKGVESMLTEEKTKIDSAILKWVGIQKGFLIGQRKMYKQFLNNVSNELLRKILIEKINEENFDRNVEVASTRAEYLEESYRLTVLAAEAGAAKDSGEMEKVQAILTQSTRLSKNQAYIKPGAKRHEVLAGSTVMDIDIVTTDLLHEIGYEMV